MVTTRSGQDLLPLHSQNNSLLTFYKFCRFPISGHSICTHGHVWVCEYMYVCRCSSMRLQRSTAFFLHFIMDARSHWTWSLPTLACVDSQLTMYLCFVGTGIADLVLRIQTSGLGTCIVNTSCIEPSLYYYFELRFYCIWLGWNSPYRAY